MRQVFRPEPGARLVAQALSGAVKEYSTVQVVRGSGPARLRRLDFRRGTSGGGCRGGWWHGCRRRWRYGCRGTSLNAGRMLARAWPEEDTRGSPTARDRGLQRNNPRVYRVYRLPVDDVSSDGSFFTVVSYHDIMHIVKRLVTGRAGLPSKPVACTPHLASLNEQSEEARVRSLGNVRFPGRNERSAARACGLLAWAGWGDVRRGWLG